MRSILKVFAIEISYFKIFKVSKFLHRIEVLILFFVSATNLECQSFI